MLELFAKLPPEIQIRILQLAIAKPTVITRSSGIATPGEYLARQDAIDHVLNLSPFVMKSLTFDRPVSNNAIVERFLKQQESPDDVKFQEIFIHPCDPPGREAWMNWTSDCLFVQRGTWLSTTELELYQNLRFLAMEYAPPFWGSSRSNQNGAELIKSLPNLRRVVILLSSRS
ncbi:hypothetical protein F4778DRAFT_744595 [Xylariomycetidae sp. FL2044]|nr:hypothetical protein F4778DRAFT_744595 [Xylariomycetidae sp. FL2044]